MKVKLGKGYTAIKDPEIVPDSMYDVQVVKVEDTTAKESGNPMTVLTVKILDQNAPLISICLVEKMFTEDWYMLMIKKMCLAFGVSDDGELDFDHFQGQTANLRVGIEESTNPEYPDAKNVLIYPALK